jgi:4a-hydroxytetrahydrobiopterin dehydratase
VATQLETWQLGGGKMRRLDDAAINERLAQLEGWTLDGSLIRKTYRLDSFPEAIAFVHRIAEIAQRADHHPDIDIRFDRVTCAVTTHSAGGLTGRDFDLAREIDAVL